MYSADEIYDTAELDNIPSIPDQHFTDLDIDDTEDVDGDGEGDDYNNAPVYPMPFFKPDDKPDKTDEDLEPSDDFGGSFPLSVEYDDDQPEPTYIDHDHEF